MDFEEFYGAFEEELTQRATEKKYYPLPGKDSRLEVASIPEIAKEDLLRGHPEVEDRVIFMQIVYDNLSKRRAVTKEDAGLFARIYATAFLNGYPWGETEVEEKDGCYIQESSAIEHHRNLSAMVRSYNRLHREVHEELEEG